MIGFGRCGIHTQWNTTQPQKKRWHNAICSNMDGTRDSHPEWNEPERQRQIPYGITYHWNLISSTNEHLLRRENHGLREETCGCLMGGAGEGGIESLGLSDTTCNRFTRRSCWIALRTMSRYSCCNRRSGGGKNVIAIYTCKDNLTPLLYSGKIKRNYKKT